MGDRGLGRRVGGRHARLVLVALVLVVGGSVAGCTVTVAGSAEIAPYRSPALDGLIATPVRAVGAGVLALSPTGATVAVMDQEHGVCLRPVGSAAGGVCAVLTLKAKRPITAAFSPDGQQVALGLDVSTQGGGAVYLVDVRTGRTLPVLGTNTPAKAGNARPSVVDDGPAGAASASSYTGMVWNSAGGHLLLISNSFEAAGPVTRLVDVDPGSLIPRVVAQATGPYEFQSGYLASGGSKVLFTVYRGDQIPPNVVVIDLATGVRKEFGPLGANGTQLVPLAVAPDGRQAIVGSATDGPAGPPHLLDLSTGTLTQISGIAGDFVAASYSPDGAELAVVSHSVAGTRLEVAPRSGVRARTVSALLPITVVAGSRLGWSGSDLLSITGRSAPAAGSVVGWALSTH